MEERLRRDLFRLADGRHIALGEVVAVDPGLGGIVVDDEDLVGQEQHHVALVVGTGELQIDGVELEGKIIAEGAEEADGSIFFPSRRVR